MCFFNAWTIHDVMFPLTSRNRRLTGEETNENFNISKTKSALDMK